MILNDYGPMSFTINGKQFPATEDLTMADLKRNQPTLDNIKIWDSRPLRDSYRQLQVIRLYYDFPNINVDRYRVGQTRYQQVMLAALRDNLHNTLDEFDGDVMQFDEHADGFELASPSLGESRSGSLTPRSRFELDAILPQLGIESPEAYS